MKDLKLDCLEIDRSKTYSVRLIDLYQDLKSDHLLDCHNANLIKFKSKLIKIIKWSQQINWKMKSLILH